MSSTHVLSSDGLDDPSLIDDRPQNAKWFSENEELAARIRAAAHVRNGAMLRYGMLFVLRLQRATLKRRSPETFPQYLQYIELIRARARAEFREARKVLSGQDIGVLLYRFLPSSQGQRPKCRDCGCFIRRGRRFRGGDLQGSRRACDIKRRQRRSRWTP